MAILTQQQYFDALKTEYEFVKDVQAVITQDATTFDGAGLPAPGTLAIGNTAAGISPVDTDTGYPTLDAIPAGHKLCLSRVTSFGIQVAQNRLRLFDRVFAAGAYSFGATTTLASQPSFSTRIPGGTDYKGLQLWVENVTAFTGSPVITIEYTNQDNVSGRTATIAISPLTIRATFQVNLQAGDTGVRQINSVSEAGGTAGTYNVMILRPLFRSYQDAGATGQGLVERSSFDYIQTGLPEIFAGTAFYPLWQITSSSRIATVRFELASG